MFSFLSCDFRLFSVLFYDLRAFCRNIVRISRFGFCFFCGIGHFPVFLPSLFVDAHGTSSGHKNDPRIISSLGSAYNHSHKKRIVWKHGPNWPFYALMLRTKLY